MTIRQQLNAIITRDYSKYVTFAKNMANGRDCPDDVLQECLLDLYEKPDEKIEPLLAKLDFYIIRMIQLSYTSKTSKFQQKYNRLVIDHNKSATYVLDSEPDDEHQHNTYAGITYEDIEQCLMKHCDWFTKEVFMRYVKSGLSFKKFSKQEAIPIAFIDETGVKTYQDDYINVSSLYKAYRKGKDVLKEHLLNKDI